MSRFFNRALINCHLININFSHYISQIQSYEKYFEHVHATGNYLCKCTKPGTKW